MVTGLIFILTSTPLWFITICKRKWQIEGPWDEATITVPIDGAHNYE